MRTLSPDTSYKAERVLIDLICKAPVFRRLQLVNSLIKTTRQLSWQGICERYSNESMEVRIKRFIFLLYKDESLAEKIVDLMIEKNRINEIS